MNKIIVPSEGKGAIFLGNIYAAYNLDILKSNNITAVLTIAAGTQLKYDPEQNFYYQVYCIYHYIRHKIINADDVETYTLNRHFDVIIDFID